MAKFEKLETTDCVFCPKYEEWRPVGECGDCGYCQEDYCIWGKPKAEEKPEPIPEPLLCPMRKLTKTYAAQTHDERFLPCLKEECAWWVEYKDPQKSGCVLQDVAACLFWSEGRESDG